MIFWEMDLTKTREEKWGNEGESELGKKGEQVSGIAEKEKSRCTEKGIPGFRKSGVNCGEIIYYYVSTEISQFSK